MYNIFFVISFWFMMIAHMELEKEMIEGSKSNCEIKNLNLSYICIHIFCLFSIFFVNLTSSKTIYFI